MALASASGRCYGCPLPEAKSSRQAKGHFRRQGGLRGQAGTAGTSGQSGQGSEGGKMVLAPSCGNGLPDAFKPCRSNVDSRVFRREKPSPE